MLIQGKHIGRKSYSTLLGVFIALIVVMQSVYVAPPIDAEDKQEQSETPDTNEQQVASSDAIASSPSQIYLIGNQPLIDRDEAQQEEETIDPMGEYLLPALQKSFKVLFQKIISPNAP